MQLLGLTSDIMNILNTILNMDNNHAVLLIKQQESRSDRICNLEKNGIFITHDQLEKPIVIFPAGFHISISHCNAIEMHIYSKLPCGLDIEHGQRKLSSQLINSMNIQEEKALEYWLEIEAYKKLTQNFLFTIIRSPAIWPKLYKWQVSYGELTACILSFNEITKFIVIGNKKTLKIQTDSLLHTHEL